MFPLKELHANCAPHTRAQLACNSFSGNIEQKIKTPNDSA
jgi:hypothetical protein